MAITLGVIGAAAYLNGVPHHPTVGLAPLLSRPGPCAATIYPAGSEYRFEQCAGGEPLGWGPCRSLTVSVDPSGAPAAWPADIADATGQLAAATGLRLRMVRGSADISISWASAAELSSEMGGDKAGVTQVRTVSTPAGSRLVSASVRISTMLGAGGGPDGETPVLLHELGHAVGMGHYQGAVVMNPVDQGYPVYQPGDLAGLGRLYRPVSCR